jgi:signal transduction histidine kinase
VREGRVVIADDAAALRRAYEGDEVRRLLESERLRLAARLHDDSLQVMTATAMRLQLLRDELDDAEHVELLDRLEETVSHATARLRQLVSELRSSAQDS